MTHKEKTERLNELLSDKTLSFGCRVISPSGRKITLARFQKTTGKEVTNFVGQKIIAEPATKEYGIFITEEGTEYYFAWSEGSKTQILGHPVTLGRVLFQMEKLIKPEKFMEFCDYRYILVTGGKNPNERKWDLSKDSLNQQSPETIDFLFSIFFPDENP